MSADNPANTIHNHSPIASNSPSTHGLNPHYKDCNVQPLMSLKEKQQSVAAGLSYANSLHKFHYFNGNKDKPMIFSNFIKYSTNNS